MSSKYAFFALILVAGMLEKDFNTMMVPAYTQEWRTDTFIHATDLLPALDDLSVCFWLFGVPDDDDRVFDSLLSIATAAEDNEFVLGFRGTGALSVLHQNTEFSSFPVFENSSVADQRFLGWNHHCFTIAKGQKFKWYSRSPYTDKLELRQSVDASNLSIWSGGALVLLQDQDSQFGGFDIALTTEGKIALFNMWDQELNYDQLRCVNCLTVGNLLTMDSMSISGPASFSQEEVQCYPVGRPEIDSSTGVTFYRMTGVKLEYCVLANITSVTNTNECLVGCAKYPDCFSVNHNEDYQYCELSSYSGGLSELKIDGSFSYYYLALQNIP